MQLQTIAPNRNGMPSPWQNGALDDTLRKIYFNGSGEWVAAQIKKLHGITLTRNAVIGRANRIGLAGFKGNRGNTKPRERRPSTARAAPRPVLVAVKDVESLKQYLERGAPEHFIGTAFRDLKRRSCRYPYDIDGITLFCGQPKLTTSSYCAECHRLCWRPVERRRAAALNIAAKIGAPFEIAQLLGARL